VKKILLATVLLTLIGCSKQSDNNENMTQPAVAQPEIEEKSDSEKYAELLASQDTLSKAVNMIKPTMSDEFDAFPSSAGILASWMNEKNVKISDIRSLESSTRGKILKDSFSERGKRLCISATLVEIQVDRSAGFAAYHAGLVNNYTDVTRVLAIGSTGDLVADSNATFCGVIVGKVGFTNASGGTTNAPYLVGMFDLPENR
jgi:hypothetical protein